MVLGTVRRSGATYGVRKRATGETRGYPTGCVVSGGKLSCRQPEMCKIGRISDGQWMEESFRGSTAACDCQYDGQCDGDGDGIPELAMQRNRAKISGIRNGNPTLIKYAASRYPVSHAPFMHGVGPSCLPSLSASS